MLLLQNLIAWGVLCNENRSAAKIGPAGPILAAKTGPPCQFRSPSENVISKQSKVASYSP